jgi:hypothetical protein
MNLSLDGLMPLSFQRARRTPRAPTNAERMREYNTLANHQHGNAVTDWAALAETAKRHAYALNETLDGRYPSDDMEHA